MKYFIDQMLFYMYLTYLFRVKHSDSGDILIPTMPLKYLIVKKKSPFYTTFEILCKKITEKVQTVIYNQC